MVHLCVVFIIQLHKQHWCLLFTIQRVATVHCIVVLHMFALHTDQLHHEKL